MFFELSKIFWFIANPSNLFFLLFAIASLSLWTQYSKLGRKILLVLVFSSSMISIFSVGDLMYFYLESRFPSINHLPPKINGVVIAGGIIDPILTHKRGDLALGSAVERLTKASEIILKYKEAKILFSGGSGMIFNQTHKEGHYVSSLLKQLGVPLRRIIVENKARNTYENAKYTFEKIKPKKDEIWILITSAFHMPRAIGAFRKVGWDVIAYPVDFSTPPSFEWNLTLNIIAGLQKFSGASKEYLGLFFYWLTNKSSAFFPAP